MKKTNVSVYIYVATQRGKKQNMKTERLSDVGCQRITTSAVCFLAVL
jgi:hypothetical protein